MCQIEESGGLNIQSNLEIPKIGLIDFEQHLMSRTKADRRFNEL